MCTGYDQAGLLLESKVLSATQERQFLASSWGVSICDQCEILHAYLTGPRAPGKPGVQFFRHFAALYAKAAAAYPTRSAQTYPLPPYG